MPAPSVGVRKPSQMPPRAPKMMPANAASTNVKTCPRRSWDIATRGVHYICAGEVPAPGTMADDIGSHKGEDRDVDDHHRCQGEPWKNSSQKQFAYGLVRQNTPNHQQQTWRYQHPKASAAGDQSEREWRTVAVTLHLRIGDVSEDGRRRHAGAGHESKDHVADHSRVGEAPRQPVQPTVHDPKQIRGQPGAGDELTHQKKHRHHSKEVIAQRFVSRATDEVQGNLEILRSDIQRQNANGT